MNKIVFSFIFLFYLSTICIGQNAHWVSTVSSIGFDDCNDLYVDQNGNVYVTGQMEYTASFNGYTRSSAGSHDVFIARYDSSGALTWANIAGGTDGDIGMSIAVDHSGNSYLCGEFESTSQFDNITKTAQGSNNIFVAKYDQSGHAVWVKSIGTNSGSTKGYAVTCDSAGNVYASGTVTARAYYSGSTLFSSRGSEDILLIKFDTYGNYQWFKQIGGSGSDHCFGLATRGNNLYVTGSFENTAKFSSSVSLHSDGGKDFFIAQYDTTGSLNWAKAGGGNGDDIGWDVTINTNDKIFCTGEFRGSGEFDNNSIVSDGNSDVLIVAYDSSGNNIWARSAGGNQIDYGKCINHDSNGNLLIGGVFTDDADFDQASITSVSVEDVFIAVYDSAGNFLRVKSYGGPNHDRGNGIGLDKFGNIYFAGEFRTSISFDTINISATGIYDGYIVRFGNYPVCQLQSEISNAITCFNNCDGAITLTPDGMPPFIYEWLLLPQVHSNSASNLCAGNYPVDVTDSYGCIASAVVEVPQPSQLEIGSQLVQNTSCIGCNDGSIQVDIIGGVSPYSYIWNDGNTSEDRNFLSPGIYSVCVTDLNGCNFCKTFNVLNGVTGIINNINSPAIEVFPNPAVDFINIRYHNSNRIEKHIIEIENSLGKKLKTIISTGELVQISMQEFSNGIYFLKVIDQETLETYSILPVILQH